MTLGGPLFGDCSTPDLWVSEVRRHGYTAAFCPVAAEMSDDEVRGYEVAAARAGIVIAEVGAWSNPLSPDPAQRREALLLCQTQLALADRVGARCCVNISGSRGAIWDGPDSANLTDETFDMIVQSVRDIIDAVQPARSYYALETMPWMYPDTADSYLRLIEAIDRRQFAVHLDPVNLICSPRRYLHNAAFIADCFHKLGPYIKSCHAKDISLAPHLTVHLAEVRPGLGALDYGVFLGELAKLEPTTPLMLEHLASEQEYRLAADHIRKVAGGQNIIL